MTLHAALIPNWRQLLGAVHALSIKAAEWSDANGAGQSTLLDARLADDMLPLAYQFKSCWVHSALALESVREGAFHPNMDPPPATWAGITDLLASAIAGVDACDEGELERIAGNPMVFEVPGRIRLDFTVQDFLLSFTNPNLFFHGVTAYDILRARGMEIGKADYIGKMRLARPPA